MGIQFWWVDQETVARWQIQHTRDHMRRNDPTNRCITRCNHGFKWHQSFFWKLFFMSVCWLDVFIYGCQVRQKIITNQIKLKNGQHIVWNSNVIVIDDDIIQNHHCCRRRFKKLIYGTDFKSNISGCFLKRRCLTLMFDSSNLD